MGGPGPLSQTIILTLFHVQTRVNRTLFKRPTTINVHGNFQNTTFLQNYPLPWHQSGIRPAPPDLYGPVH